VAAIGSVTALLGAAIAVAQFDLKRGPRLLHGLAAWLHDARPRVGSWAAAIFHLLTHAFFKALLFLAAGSVIHAAHHEQDMRSSAACAGPMRSVTFATFAVGMMALSGVPFLFSGFWSKEAILHARREWAPSQLPLYVGLAGSSSRPST